MSRLFLIWVLGLIPLQAYSQLVDIIVEPIAVHDDGNSELAGMTTYHVYALCENQDDFVSGVYGDTTYPLNLSSSAGFYQHPEGSGLGWEINSDLFEDHPNLEYDSWLTVGVMNQNEVTGYPNTLLLESEMLVFEAGGNLTIASELGGGWYTLNGDEQAQAGPDLKVLLAQLTVENDAQVDGVFNIDVWTNGQGTESSYSTGVELNFPTAVTFQVDMTQESSVSSAGVHIAGEFQGWDASASPLTDVDGDGVWEITLALEQADYSFKYINGDSWTDPVEAVYGDCADGQGFRVLSVGSEPITSLACFNSCEESCPLPTPVTFQVDMSQESSVSSSGIHIAGDFQGWDPGSSSMSDDDGDGIWEISMLLDQGDHLFKFINGDSWEGVEDFPGEDCADDWGNRLITVGEEPLEYEACFSSCEACPTDDDLPWVHDCHVDSCGTWVFGNGAGLAGTPWEGIDLSFECTTDGPSGPYNQWAGGAGDGTPAAAMNSGTADNGLLLIDSDLYGADYGDGANWVENSWVQTAEPMSCAITDFVRMSFQTRYRCWDNGNSNDNEKCLVEVSRDGVNWPDINTTSEEDGYVDYGNGDLIASRFEVFPEFNTGDQTDNPSVINLDISSAAGGQSNIWIRFRWVGTWGYSWEIDDIVLAPIPDNDLKIGGYVSTTDYLNTGTVEVGAIPQGQINAYQAGVEVVNTGLNEQNQISVGLFSDGQLLGESDTTTIYYDSEMVFQFDYNLTELDTGFHELEFEIYNTAPLNGGSPWWDETPDDNQATKTIEITEYQLGRDNGIMTSSFPTNDPDYFSVINPFHVNEDATVYGIDVAFAEGSAITQDAYGYLQIGGNVDDVISTWQNVVAEAWEIGIGEHMLNAPGDSIIMWTTMLFEEPVSVSQGDWVGAVIESFDYTEPIRVGMAQDVYPNTCFVEGPFGSNGSYDLYYTAQAPMIRLNFDPNALPTGIGCLSENSCNYNPNAFEPYVYCDTESCAGCLDSLACNYDPSFTLSHPYMCTYPGCMDPEANNYDELATCEGECIYLYYDCGSIGDPDWAFEEMGVFPSFQQAMHGVSWNGQWVFNIPEDVVEPSSGYVYPIHHVNWTAVEGVPDWVDQATYTLEELNANTQHCIEATGVPSAPGWHDIVVTAEVFISIFGQPFSIGEQFFSATLEVQSNPNPILGCTYQNAPNFTPYATQDDGSCLFPGCTDPQAGNFNPLATVDDGSCGEACETNDDAFCEADNDGDGVITVSDLLILLGAFGSTCE